MSDPRVRPVTKAGSQEALKVGVIANNIRMQQMQQRPQQQQQQPIPSPQQVSISPSFLLAAFCTSVGAGFFYLQLCFLIFGARILAQKHS
jgi:hypothetical protein